MTARRATRISPADAGDLADFERIDRVLAAVLAEPDDFTAFEYDFAVSNASRIAAFRERTFWSAEQLNVIRSIEAKIGRAS